MDLAETWNALGLDTQQVLIGAGIAALFQVLKKYGVGVGGPRLLKYVTVAVVLLVSAVGDSQISGKPWLSLWISGMAANAVLYTALRTVVSGKPAPEPEPLPQVDALDQPGTSDDE